LAVDGGEDQQPAILLSRSDDVDTRAVDAQRGNVQAQLLIVRGDGPRRHPEEQPRRDEQRLDDFRRDAPPVEITRLIGLVGQRLEHELQEIIEFGRGGDADRDRIADGGPDLGRERGVGDADRRGAPCRARRRSFKRGPQHPCKGSRRFPGIDHLLAHDET